MKEYIFINILNSNIEIKIKAKHYNEAMEILLMEVRHVSDYKIENY
jgi:hypothetical protein